MDYRTVSIIIPVYNEERFIRDTVQRVFDSDTAGLRKEIIIIDDGSNDKTIIQIKNQIAKIKKKGITTTKIFLIQKSQNEGKCAALKDGFMECTGDIVIVQDADLEYSPDDYPLLLEPFLKNDADVVYGSRFVSNRPHRVLYFWHYIVNRFLTTFSNAFTNINLTDMETGYKAFNGDLIRDIAPMLTSKRFGFEPEITARLAKIKGIKWFEVGISYSGRTYEEGKKIGWKDGIQAVWDIVRYNVKQ